MLVGSNMPDSLRPLVVPRMPVVPGDSRPSVGRRYTLARDLKHYEPAPRR